MGNDNKTIDRYMPLWVGKYLNKTTRLNAEQHGIYLLLLMDIWVNGPIKNDENLIISVTKIDKKTWKKHKEIILNFFYIQDGFLTNKKLEKEKEFAKKRSSKAKEAADLRWKNKDASNFEGKEDICSEHTSEECDERCSGDATPQHNNTTNIKQIHNTTTQQHNNTAEHQKTVVVVEKKSQNRTVGRILAFKRDLAREEMAKTKKPMINPTGFLIDLEKQLELNPRFLPEWAQEVRQWRLKNIRQKLEKRREFRAAKARIAEIAAEKEKLRKIEAEYSSVMAKIKELPVDQQVELERMAIERARENFQDGAMARIDSGSAWGKKLLMPYFVEVFYENLKKQGVKNETV